MILKALCRCDWVAFQAMVDANAAAQHRLTPASAHHTKPDATAPQHRFKITSALPHLGAILARVQQLYSPARP